MKDQSKTKQILIQELVSLRQRIAGLEQSESEHKQKKEERKAHIRFLESLERVDQAIKQETDVEQMLRHILQTVFSIFDCDRCWLFYPCDPDAPTFRVPMEICRPEYPGAKVLNVNVPISTDMAQNLREALASDAPVIYIAGTEKPINKVTAKQFGVQSQMFVALYPKLGKPWLFGMHQCSYPRIWTEEEKKLFKEIGHRISDGLSSVLFLRELQENEARLSETQRLAQIGSWEWNLITNHVWWSDGTYWIFGVTPQDFVPSFEANSKLIHPDDFARYIKSFEHSLQTGEPLDIDIRLVTNDGLLKHCHAKGKLFYEDSAQPTRFIGTIMDITDRKHAEDALHLSEENFRHSLEDSPLGVRIVTVEGETIYANRAILDIYGYDSMEEFKTTPVENRYTPESFAEHQIRKEKRKRGDNAPSEYEIRIVRKDGEVRHLQVFRKKILWDGERQFQVLYSDITDRKQAEEQIKASLREKEILLREVHHRVKNNMQVISGLLDLQARSSGNPELTGMLNESQSRIHAMSLVHEKLYGSKDFARIDLAGYVRTISQDLFQSYKINPGEIDLIVKTDGDVYMDINKAIPCGLILNELISNALKHAFLGDRQGEIQILINETKNTEIEIVIRDNGLGLPDDIDIHEFRSLGLDLVNGLVRNQLDGQIEVRRDNGTEFRIKFPL
jgi:PAS domain S-box-containing protein